jgi:membrane protein implicated in regulation of membrane protease activity
VIRPLFTLAAVGVAGFALWKVMSLLFVPLLGPALALVFFLVKIALVVGLVFLVVSWLRKDKREDRGTEEKPAA